MTLGFVEICGILFFLLGLVEDKGVSFFFFFCFSSFSCCCTENLSGFLEEWILLLLLVFCVSVFVFAFVLDFM